MYSDKKIVNILTSILIANGIKNAVICPGSRNIPITANLTAAKEMDCISVVDERSAAFYALGMSLATGLPTVVCVTSGSAFLNTLPAIAEAHYRQIPIILITADRPQQWIDRNDGQTMLQHGMAYNLFKAEADVSDCDDEEAANHSRLLLNNTINSAMSGAKGPVHINLHLHEPLFDFNEKYLPTDARIKLVSPEPVLTTRATEIIKDFIAADNKAIVIGQLPHHNQNLDWIIKQLKTYYVVMCEQLSTAEAEPVDSMMGLFDDMTTGMDIDMVFALGNTLVSKSLKQYMRKKNIHKLWEINESGKIHDTFMGQTGVIECSCEQFLCELLRMTKSKYDSRNAASENTDNEGRKYLLKDKWDKATNAVGKCIDNYVPIYSQMLAIRNFELSLHNIDYDYEVHYANSMEVRIGCLYSPHYIWCNRGINGIEGSISTAAGFSMVTSSMVFCIAGDLSFFYDQNALWNSNLKSNFRILVLNNSRGGIFSQLKGLDVPDETMGYIEGRHSATAKGICEQNDIDYIAARDIGELHMAMSHFVTAKSERPMVLEVFSSPEDDKQAYAELKYRINNKQII